MGQKKLELPVEIVRGFHNMVKASRELALQVKADAEKKAAYAEMVSQVIDRLHADGMFADKDINIPATKKAWIEDPVRTAKALLYLENEVKKAKTAATSEPNDIGSVLPHIYGSTTESSADFWLEAFGSGV